MDKPEELILPEGIKKKYGKVKLERIYRYPDMLDSYIDYAKNVHNRKLFTGLPAIDKLLYAVRPPEIVTILASPNTGKSALLMHAIDYNVDNNAMLKEKLLIIFSLEMNQDDLIERQLQRMYNLYSFQVEKKIRDDKDGTLEQEMRDKLVKFNNIVTVIKRITPVELVQYIKAIEEMMGQKAGAIMIDYIQLIDGDDHKSDAKIVSDGMKQIKEVAIQLNLPFVIASQVSRSAAQSDEGLSMFSGKFAGEIENSSQIVLGLENLNEEEAVKVFDKGTVLKFKQQKLELKKLTIFKKKRGMFGKVYLILDTKELSIKEYQKPPDTNFPPPTYETRADDKDEEKPF